MVAALLALNCEADGIYAPEYTVNPGDIMVRFTAPEKRIVRMNSSEPEKNSEVGTVNGTVNGIETKVSTPLEEDILKLVRENATMTYNEIAQALGVSRRSLGRKMQELKASGVIIRVGSDKIGSWKIND